MTRPVGDPWLYRPPLGEWAEQAACAGMPPHLFYPPPGPVPKVAKETCAICPVREECLDYALTNRETYGVWGGLGEGERDAIRRKRRRAAA